MTWIDRICGVNPTWSVRPFAASGTKFEKIPPAVAWFLADVNKKYYAELKDIKFSPSESFRQAESKHKETFQENERKRRDAEKRAAGEQSMKDAYEARNGANRKSAYPNDKPKPQSMGGGFFIMVLLLVLLVLPMIVYA